MLLLTCSLLAVGYGFVDFQNAVDAQKAVQALQANGILAQFAKVDCVVYVMITMLG